LTVKSAQSVAFLFFPEQSMIADTNLFSEVTESFYLETHEGLFFAVKGSEHPPDRFIAVLRYAPDPGGSRSKGGVAYRRMYHFAEQEQWIRSSCPDFLAYDSVFQIVLQSVPRSRILRVYDPRLRLQEMMQMPGKPIEKDAADFAALLQEPARVPRSAIGITGSLLIGLDTENSDLDVSVFGAPDCFKVYEALKKLLDSESHQDLRRLDIDELKDLYHEREADTQEPSFDEFAALERNKICQGHFRGRPYFIRFIKEANTAAAYGSARYTPVGRATITATVARDQDAIFTPCRYFLSDVQVLEGPAVQVSEIVSFRGRFCEQAWKGDAVKAAGMLERIENSRGEIRHRLLLGNSPSDYLLRRS
jgi:uncharacterized protein